MDKENWLVEALKWSQNEMLSSIMACKSWVNCQWQSENLKIVVSKLKRKVCEQNPLTWVVIVAKIKVKLEID